MKKWSEVDFAMSSYGFPDGLQRNLKVTAIVVMTAAIGNNYLLFDNQM